MNITWVITWALYVQDKTRMTMNGPRMIINLNLDEQINIT